MICYKDKTFCSSNCIRKDCWRYFGDEQQDGARKWWSHDPDNAPITFSDFSNDCFWYQEPKND